MKPGEFRSSVPCRQCLPIHRMWDVLEGRLGGELGQGVLCDRIGLVAEHVHAALRLITHPQVLHNTRSSDVATAISP